MKEHSLIFGAEKLRYIFSLPSGAEFQTRRALKLGPNATLVCGQEDFHLLDLSRAVAIDRSIGMDGIIGVPFTGPSGGTSGSKLDPLTCVLAKWHAGDRIWVKESASYEYHGARWENILYKADLNSGQLLDFQELGLKWVSPIYMPREASRLTLEVVEVRGQRLLDISNDDAEAEGACQWAQSLSEEVFERLHRDAGTWPAPSPRQAYFVWWDQLNAKRGFPSTSNPWVWALTLRTVL